MRVTLERVGSSERHGTLGYLEAGELRLVTLEPPWRGNAPGVSCVPPGEYRLEAHLSERWPLGTWALVGGTVSHFPEAGKARSAVLFHPANRADELRGCIAVGRRFGVFRARRGAGGVLGILPSSESAMADLRAHLSIFPEPHRLVITGGPTA